MARKRQGRHRMQKRRVEQRNKMHRERYTEKYKETEDLLEKKLLFRMILKKNEVPAKDPTPAIQKLSHMIVRLLRWELPQSGIQLSALDGSAKLTDVAKHRAGDTVVNN